MAAALVGFVALGSLIGGVGGVFGIGGGAVAIPALGLLCGLDQQTAQGTALVMIVPNVLLSFWRYRQRGRVDLRIAAMLAGFALISTYPVARFATGLSPAALRLGFAGFLAVFAAIIARRALARPTHAQTRPPVHWGWSAVLGIAGGIVSGFFGVGGALIAPPVLTAYFGVRQAEAQGLALALVAPGSIVAFIAYAEAAKVEWLIGAPMAAGGVLSVSLGVALAYRLPERRLRLAFACLLVATSCLLVLRA
ncbi:MAG TPA: sulfite exporter TauE/SafE family protein [Stellaceae bacterium]|jgi:hypothetical protein|nr:sulfite exporter TauE/SafE family protein [Stellaceae bacterium]